MNKYSKRALKTTATVGMSLAMVLSAVTPVNAAFGAPTVDTTTQAMNFIAKLNDALGKEGLSLETIQAGDQITLGTEKDYLARFDGTSGKYTVDSVIKTAVDSVMDYVSYKGDEYNTAEYVNGLEKAIQAMIEIASDTSNVSLVEKAKTFVETTSNYTGGSIENMLTISAYENALALQKEFDDNAKYEGNLPAVDNGVAGTSAKAGYHTADEYATAKEALFDVIEAFQAENYGETLDKYLTQLENLYQAFIENDGKDGITKAKVDALVKKIKAGNFSTTGYQVGSEMIIAAAKLTALTEANYKAFKDDSGVTGLLELFDDAKGSVTDVADALSEKNEYTIALAKTKASRYSKNQTLKAYLNATPFATVIDNLKVTDFEILKDYKENVIDVVLTLDSKEVGNIFVERTEKSPYVTAPKLETLIKNMTTDGLTVSWTNGQYGIFTMSDKETGSRYYDDIVDHMTEVVDSLEALANISKLDSITLLAGDREKLIAADDAVYFLQSAGKANLTSKETRTVRDASRKVTELMEVYRVKFGSIDTTVNGWVDKGNGNWTYYENGSAVTKWVAAGSDWFYVKGGNMLRNAWVAENASGARWYYVNDKGVMVTNTTIDGYAIDANGVWTK